MPSVVPCPKCQRPLELAGEVSLNDGNFRGEFPVYQCNECLVVKSLMGKEIEMALTLVKTTDGNLRDPDTLRVIS